MDLRAYLNAAKAARGLQSDNQLAKALDTTRAHVSDMRAGHRLPGDELMSRIAEMAGEDRELALLRLNYWRARHGTAKATYKRMIERLGYAAGVAAFGFTALGAPSPPARAFSESADAVYYGNKRVDLRFQRSLLSSRSIAR